MIKTTVTDIENQGDRVLLYNGAMFLGARYHIIAKPEDAAGIQAGDTILYEPVGVNFGILKARTRAYEGAENSVDL